ncbi:MAG: hypothetical protein IAF94_12900 [Pirellulaceae bacterium]|nr:hypothetical protein [Pirellulaceae bacterium]
MQSIAIFPVFPPEGTPRYRAVTRSGQSEGTTVGEALDGVRKQSSEDSSGTVVVIQPFQPDELFSAAEQTRLSELMEKWRNARDGDGTLLPSESKELESLVDAELQAATLRTARMLKEMGK